MVLIRNAFFAAVLVATSATALGLVGCGDDDNGTNNPPDGAPPTPPPVNPPVNPPPPPGPPDGGDGGCNFNDFVINLINTQTTDTAKPSTDLGDNCVDNQTPFPTTLF
jgi:hypothetical protein